MTMREYEKLCQMVSSVKGFVIDGQYFLESGNGYVADVANSRIRLTGAIKAIRELEYFLRFISISDEHKYQIEDEQKSEKEEENGN